MKNLFIILLLTITKTIFSQNSVEILILDKINEYRIENGVSELIWCKDSYNAAKKHNNYLIKNKLITHREKSNTPTISSRLEYYGVEWYSCGENCTSTFYDLKDNDEQIAQSIFNSWRDSKSHNENMLSEYTKCGISYGVGTLEEFGDDFVWNFSTIVFYTD